MHLRLKTTSETESESASAEGSKEYRRIAEVLVEQAVYLGKGFF